MLADNVFGRDCSQNFTFALEASLLGQIFIFQTISQKRTLSADIPAPPERVYLLIIQIYTLRFQIYIYIYIKIEMYA